MPPPPIPIPILILIPTFFFCPSRQNQETNPLTPVNLTTSSLIPSFPTTPPNHNLTCHLDLSAELFAGVSSACSSSPSASLDRSRCCPVLAAWLFSAHARSALAIPQSSQSLFDDTLPLPPDDSQMCVDSLHASLDARKIKLPAPNDTCDTVLCFCGIRLHQIGSLSCPAAFAVRGGNVTRVVSGGGGNVTGSGRGMDMATVTPTAAVKRLEKDCLNSSYAGCTRCLQSLEKIKGGSPAKQTTDRAVKMFNRDCQLMGLTWLLAKNRTAYIPTVSAVIRAVLYSSHPPTQPYKCSPDQENMPLAVDSLQFQRLDSSSAAATAISSSTFVLGWVIGFRVLLLLVLALWKY